MDGTRFDQLARNLVTRTDRRQVLQRVSGLVAALLGTGLGVEMTVAKGRKRHKQRVRTERNTGGGKPAGRCAAGRTNCRGTCVDIQTDPEHCGACATRCSGAASTCCGGVCVDSQTDRSQCGACGHVCNLGVGCQGGTCVCTGETCTDEFCSCATTVGGEPMCINGGNTDCQPCTKDAACDLSQGERCIRLPFVGDQQCFGGGAVCAVIQACPSL